LAGVPSPAIANRTVPAAGAQIGPRDERVSCKLAWADGSWANFRPRAKGSIGGEVAVPDARPDPEAAVLRLAHVGERQPRHVDEHGRLRDPEPHQVDEVRPPAEERRTGCGDGCDRFVQARRRLVPERPQDAASSIAATMFG